MNAIGVPAAQHPDFHVSRPCINVDFPANGRVGPPQNQGFVLTDPRQVTPHSIQSFLDQLWGQAPPQLGRAILRPVTGPDNVVFVNPTVLNTNFPLRRDVYNVIPTSRETTAPWSTVFVDSDPGAGNTALICQQTAVIQRQGFGAAANCGSIAGRST